MEKRMKLSFSIPSKARPSTNPVAGGGFRPNDNVGDSTPAPMFITVFETSQTLTPDVKSAVLTPLSNSGRLLHPRSGEPTNASTGAGSTNPVLDTSKAPDQTSSSHTSYGLITRNTAPDHVKPAVIPPLPNSGRLLNPRSGEPTDASIGVGNINSVLDTSKPPDNPSSSRTSYGLIVRNKAAAVSADTAGKPVTCPVAADGPSAASGDLMLRRYKEDMAVLPDQPGTEEYDEVPVEGFGAALLAGYGWKEGDAIGRNCTKEAKVVQYDRRTGPQGLGFDPSKKRDVERRDQMQKVPNARASQQSSTVCGSTNTNNFKVPCLHSHIRVRVVSKNMSKRLYMMKGRVLDVTGPTTCDIVMDDGTEVVQGVEQDMLETVLPPVNGHALVLCGEQKGVYGRLVQKNFEERIGVLEDADTRDMIPVGLDKIAEYVGDPELIGY
ncbi:protein MOS2-like [Lolium rigidum]|uniref:protein MOS2-like n=1 Tax=Lolium rigidum TaxID=89674 RepID=UPI001F5DD659|nr:protein MOS2-like [Lolium rigidum]